MRSYISVAFFLLSSILTPSPLANGEDLSFCYGTNSICALGNDLFDTCNQYLGDTDTTKWYQCICTNGYVSVDEACYWCQIAYNLEIIYTSTTKNQCIDDNIPIAPIPASILSAESSFNATYTGVISGAGGSRTIAAATSTDNAGAGQIFPTKSKAGDSAAATSTSGPSSSTDGPVYIITTTLASSSHSTSPATQTSPANRTSKSSGLSTGAKAGIAVGAVLGALLIIALIWIAVVLSRLTKQKAAQDQLQNQPPSDPVQPPQSVLGPGVAELGYGEKQQGPIQTPETVSAAKFWPWGGGNPDRKSQMGASDFAVSPVSESTASPQMQNADPVPEAPVPSAAVSELPGSYVQVPPGAGLPPSGHVR